MTRPMIALATGALALATAGPVFAEAMALKLLPNHSRAQLLIFKVSNEIQLETDLTFARH